MFCFLGWFLPIMAAVNVGTMHQPALIPILRGMQLLGLKINMLTSLQMKINHHTKSSPRIQGCMVGKCASFAVLLEWCCCQDSMGRKSVLCLS